MPSLAAQRRIAARQAAASAPPQPASTPRALPAAAAPIPLDAPSRAPTKHQGAVGELRAIIWLLDQGYEVFRNVSQHGHVDIVALKDGKVTLIDIAAAHKRLLPQQRVDNVKLIYTFNENLCIEDEPPPHKLLNCPSCQKEFTQSRSDMKYCSKNCKTRFRAKVRDGIINGVFNNG